MFRLTFVTSRKLYSKKYPNNLRQVPGIFKTPPLEVTEEEHQFCLTTVR